MALGVASILVIAASMLAVDAIFSLGSFTNYPSSEWASGVSKSMALFSSFGVEGNPGILGAIGGVVSGFIKGVGGAMTSATMIPIAMSMVAVDKIFSQGSFTKYPTSEWALGVSSAMAIFSNPDILKNFSEFSGQLKDLPDISALDTTSSSIAKLASSFATLASSIGLVNTNLQGFTGLYKDLSIINDNKFSNLKTSDKATFQIVNQSAEKQVNLLSSGINSSSDNLPNIVDSSVKDSKSLQMNEESEKQKKFYSDISDIKSLLYDIKDSMDQPAQAGSFYK